MSEKKTCSYCKCEFPANKDYFNRNSGVPDGLHSYCRHCGYRLATGQTTQKIDTQVDTPVMITKEAAAYCRISVDTVNKLCREGRMPHSQKTGKRTFLQYELDEWLSGMTGWHQNQLHEFQCGVAIKEPDDRLSCQANSAPTRREV